jgi:hypothetical protein
MNENRVAPMEFDDRENGLKCVPCSVAPKTQKIRIASSLWIDFVKNI